ncbi:hypothetical protein [Rhodococcus sp. NPDC003348]
MKIAIAEAAGVDQRHEIERARRAGVLTPRTEITETGGYPGSESRQLAMR